MGRHCFSSGRSGTGGLSEPPAFPFTGGLGVHYGAEKLGCTVVPISGGMTERQVQLINDFRPDIITVTP